MLMQCLTCKSQLWGKKSDSSLLEISVSIARNTIIMLPHLIIHSPLHYLSTGQLAYRKLKTRKLSYFYNYKSGRGCLWEVVAYKKFQIHVLNDLTWKLLVFWKTGRWGEVVSYKRWSQPEVRLYLNIEKHRRIQYQISTVT